MVEWCKASRYLAEVFVAENWGSPKVKKTGLQQKRSANLTLLGKEQLHSDESGFVLKMNPSKQRFSVRSKKFSKSGK